MYGIRLCRSCKKTVREARKDSTEIAAGILATASLVRFPDKLPEKWQCELCGAKAEGFFQKIITDIFVAIGFLIFLFVAIVAVSFVYLRFFP